MKTSNIFFLILLMTTGWLYAQQQLTANLNDSLITDVPSPRGALQWEQSSDSLTWSAIAGQTTNSLSVQLTTLPQFYRLRIEEGTCQVHYSEVLSVTAPPATFSCGGTISHGFVLGVTPDPSLIYASRTYTTATDSGWGGGNKCWTTMNLGATRAPNSATDNDADAAGWFWQFNRAQAYAHNGVTRTPNTPWINPINENTDWTPANDPCTQLLGAPWRLPTQAEWNGYVNAPTSNGGAGGATGNLTSAFTGGLTIHAGGGLSGGAGDQTNIGVQGLFWSAQQNSNNTAGSFRFSSAGNFPVNATKNFGYAARCVRDL
jgi:uncharacterized protein (TIGR02145 family)